MTAEEQFKAWIDSLSLLDQQLLKDHALDVTPPTKVVDLLKYSPAAGAVSFGAEPPKYYYPEPLMRALGVTPPVATAE